MKIDLYVLMVRIYKDIYCVCFDGKPSVDDVLNAINYTYEDLECTDYDLIKNMIEKDVDEVTSNSIFIKDFDVSLTLQKVTCLSKGNKYLTQIRYIKDKMQSKTSMDEIFNVHFKKIKFERLEDDAEPFFNYIAYFHDSDNIFVSKKFRSDNDFDTEDETMKRAYFLESSGFNYLKFEKASIEIIDSDTGRVIDTILEYE